ncbi:spore germination protein [Paenibacillus athensensis]|uniref:Spore germination protein n=1 Tax=Paenibacillus athensensis TaxID=1967502 RepID=A0A4Y8PUC6_9BACL|nr:spore germination protein [Paenibacillus athensensis]MCD1257988.1 spore germination protein [Paenibacillus athensensis]
MDWTEQSKEWLLDKLAPNGDLELRTLGRGGGLQIELLFIRSICDAEFIRKQLIEPYFQMKTDQEYEDYLLAFPGAYSAKNNVDTLMKLTSGYAVITLGDHMLVFNAIQVKASALSEASVESTLLGPQTAFSEHIDTNLNIVRLRYRQSSLKTENFDIGRLTQTRVCLLYDDKLVDQGALLRVRQCLDQIDVDTLQSAGELHRLMTKNSYTLFPVYLSTERPDRTIINISQGKIVLMVEGTPFVLLLPAVFFEFYSAMDDLYQLPVVRYFLKLLRYIALFTSILLPGAYVALTAYNPEIFRVQLAMSIAGSRASVPYPAYVEVIFMLVMMELLLEASIRLPKSVGSTATTVGGLILGQAATQAGLISTIMIIIVSTVAICNFVVPINTMSFAMRVVKYPLVLLASLFGVVGLVIGFVGLIGYLASLRSFGKPYLRIFWKN